MKEFLDMIIKNGIDTALDDVMDKNYCRILDKDITNLKRELELEINEDDKVKKLFTNYLYKVSELEKYKAEAIYTQGILDILELITLFNKKKYLNC